MFCQSCGEKIDDGAKFCMKCGTAVDSAFPQTAPITPTATATAPPQAVPVQQIATGTSITGNTGKNKLILTAAIVATGIWLLLLVVIAIEAVDYSLNFEAILWDLIELELVGPPFFLVLFPISIALSFSGWKKSNRPMVLIAGILYIVSFYGIPSGILCIIAFIKMKKR